MPTLTIHAPDGSQRTFEVTSRPVVLGRADTCDFPLIDDAEISREHAEIFLDPSGRIMVRDRGSKNGTRVDDGEVFRSSERSAQRSIRVGEHTIEIVGAKTEPAPQAGVSFAAEQDTRGGDTQFFPSTRGFDLNEQRLALLIQLTERIGGVFDRKQLLEEAIDACCEALGFERGLIALRTQRGDTELPVTRNIQRDEDGQFKVSRTLINRALVHGERAIVNNPATDLVDNLSESMVRFPICSALCVPILHRGDILGVIYGDRITQATTYQATDVDFFAAIAQQVGVGLANLRLMQDHVDSQRVNEELQRARSIQRGLLPPKPIETKLLTIAGYNEPSSAVSGDYFDFFHVDERRLGIIIADVTGHGMAAALVMANLQAAVRVAMTTTIPLPELAGRVNKLISQNTDASVFVTAIIGTIDSESGTLEYVSAGHPPPVVMLADARIGELPDKNSLPLGIDPDEAYRIVRIDPADGVRALLFYTDGVTEAGAEGAALMGLEPLTAALAKLPDLSPEMLIRTGRDTVKNHLQGSPLSDDLTFLAMSFRDDH